jgi:hypothetical protein
MWRIIKSREAIGFVVGFGVAMGLHHLGAWDIAANFGGFISAVCFWK